MAGTLTKSNNTGLLGILLPNGTYLLERIEGDPTQGEDTCELYSIHATAKEILDFFELNMPHSGWKRTPESGRNSLFFRKGSRTSGVLTNYKGRSFTLMGS